MKLFYVLLFSFFTLVGCSNIDNYDDGTNRGNETPNQEEKDDGTNVAIYDDSIDIYDGTNRATVIAKKKEKPKKKPTVKSSKKNITKNNSNQVSTKQVQESKPEKKEEPKKTKTVKASENKNSSTEKETPEKTEQNSIVFYYPVEKIEIKNDYIQKKHSGLDFKVETNTLVKAVGPGIVIFSKHKGGLGNSIFIYHNNGYISVYYNLKSLNVNKGDYVKSAEKTIALANKAFNFKLMKQTDKGNISLDPKKLLKKR